MIVGLGIDLISIAKIAEGLKSEAYQRKVFTPEEIAACARLKSRDSTLAGKFAAKEACMKALGAGIRQEVWFNQIQVLEEQSGKPYLTCSGEAKLRLEASGARRIHVSISHSAGMAMAVVVLEA